MADESQRPIVIRRKKKVAGGSHGGAWKIAYADFVTAMMAFFLLMWLLGSTSKSDLQGIAEYFQTPLKVALMGGPSVGVSSSVIQGGGQDLTRTEGQQKRAPVDLETAKAALARAEAARLLELKAQLETLIEATPTLRQFKRQLLLDITTEGLRIQIVDDQNRPMFASGRAELQPYTREILREIAKALNEVDNRLGLSGHTDAAPYAGGEKGYSNWELSADRANASRRELTAGGLNDGKVLRVVGLASSVPFDQTDASSAANRRISIVVLNKATEEAITRDGRVVDVERRDGVRTESIGDAVAPQPVAKP